MFLSRLLLRVFIVGNGYIVTVFHSKIRPLKERAPVGDLVAGLSQLVELLDVPAAAFYRVFRPYFAIAKGYWVAFYHSKISTE